MKFIGVPNSGQIKVYNKVIRPDGTSHKNTNPLIYNGIITPQDDEERVQDGITYAKPFWLHTAYTAEINEASKVVDWLGRSFTVRAVERYDATTTAHTRAEIVIEGKGG